MIFLFPLGFCIFCPRVHRIPIAGLAEKKSAFSFFVEQSQISDIGSRGRGLLTAVLKREPAIPAQLNLVFPHSG